ncbi:methyl-accepting chemotaxis protein signaling domain [Leptolyngbya boryana NIES-2135]|jgi:methyl-accepting chemotaxis protein|uniref:Methyl-accepting chemotaxis protein signaling domain n=1 Tax=Leptolyngbya boryana NIES-2135 TaxID=1973484 RepID=A0A1Z4JM39_LEPBY|nr:MULTISPECIES: methyl-accepting chemotaxis protein [Leptolyngbya]ULP28797.1 methyl-accepting chemotaxis protein [Leptolyngbya boryana IU 594]BAS56140.1 methyl-accepting chemotaxis sensory transducer [Leptolyngbya boryana IAM M-101]BAS62488.1 methyl-accepting chemotaxis sensory transducer [Leptolyngbya boryana dg5]BAY57687.1 methyl-accepting chemotaxis protein signaling domain [Leptolyngbya boryana NIES-2135]
MVSNSSQKQDSIVAMKATLLAAMQAVNAGDLSVRLDESNGLEEIAQEFNQWVSHHQHFAQGMSEVERVLSAIAQGNLNARIALEIEEQPLAGEVLQVATQVNAIADQLQLVASEVTRVTREIGTQGKLDSVATVKDISGDWQALIESVNQMSSQVNEQIRSIAHISRAVAQGDFANQITAENVGEFRVLTDDINQMIQNLRDSLGEIGEISATVASASEELTAVSREMTSNAGQTSEQATSASVSAEQVSQNAATVATAIEEMNLSIREIAKNAAAGAQVAMDAVKTSDQTNATITKLGQSSVEIGKVIKVITSIAQQTNLLALNATIEAARAGDAGRGFAVVASEVKELAKQTAHATEDISQRIEAIQTDTKGAVEAITQITAVINQINDIQNTIASSVEEQTATTNEIARNVTEAAQGSSDIAKNIGVLADNAQMTTTGADNTAQAATELARMAVNLQNIVQQFRGLSS